MEARDGEFKWITCHPSGECKHNDVIKSPGVLWMWWVKGELPGRLFPEVNQERGVNHWNSKAAFSHLLPDGYVSRCPFVVTLRSQAEVINVWRHKKKTHLVMSRVPRRSFHTRSLNRLHGTLALEQLWSCSLSWASTERWDWRGGCHNPQAAQRREDRLWNVFTTSQRNACELHCWLWKANGGRTWSLNVALKPGHWSERIDRSLQVLFSSSES